MFLSSWNFEICQHVFIIKSFCLRNTCQSCGLFTQTHLLGLQDFDAIKVCHDDFGEGIFLWILDMTALSPDKVLNRLVAQVDDIA
jgi:hypothetical protein